MECVKSLEDMRIDYDKFVSDNVIPSKAFERAGSDQFFAAVKDGNILKVTRMLEKVKYYVYDYDGTQQTALHWAAKRDLPEIIDLLIEYGANVNTFDVGGRTPLYLASKQSNLEAVKALLAAGAIPIYKTNSQKNAFDVATDPVIERYLVKA